MLHTQNQIIPKLCSSRDYRLLYDVMKVLFMQSVQIRQDVRLGTTLSIFFTYRKNDRHLKLKKVDICNLHTLHPHKSKVR